MDGKRDPAGAARALGDAVRFGILERLLEGPATVAELVAHVETGQSNVSNHLAVLRDLGFVAARRLGRQIEYRISDPAVAQAVEALLALAEDPRRAPRPPAPVAVARTCYDHLAGALGVRILEALIRSEAVTQPNAETGAIGLGVRWREVFGALGVDVESALRARRRLGFACLDWTERRPHLGGSLGAALCRRFTEAGWVARASSGRALTVTVAGESILRGTLRTRPPR